VWLDGEARREARSLEFLFGMALVLRGSLCVRATLAPQFRTRPSVCRISSADRELLCRMEIEGRSHQSAAARNINFVRIGDCFRIGWIVSKDAEE